MSEVVGSTIVEAIEIVKHDMFTLGIARAITAQLALCQIVENRGTAGVKVDSMSL